MAVNGQEAPSTCVLLRPNRVCCLLTVVPPPSTDGSCSVTCTAKTESAVSTRVSTLLRSVR